MNKLKRILAVVLSCLMVVTTMTASVSAEDIEASETVETTTPEETTEVAVETEETQEEDAVPEETVEEAETVAEEAIQPSEETQIAETSEETDNGEVENMEIPVAEIAEEAIDEAIAEEVVETVQAVIPAGTVSPMAKKAADEKHIDATKTCVDEDENGEKDGIYEMKLSVTGSSASSSSTKVAKSNVIIVMDRSNSMVNNEASYEPYTYNASTYDGDNKRYYYRSSNSGNYHRAYYRVRSNNRSGWYTEANGGNQINSQIYIAKNRLEAEQEALDTVVKNLLANNKNETTDDGTSLADIIEISIIGYSLYSPTRVNGQAVAATEISNSNSYTDIMNAVNNGAHSEGTNWDDGLRAAQAEAVKLKASEPNEDISIIFLTDGEPTARHGSTEYTTPNGDQWGGHKEDNAYWLHWSAAAETATAIVGAGYDFYTIFTYGSNNTYINYLNNLTRNAIDGTEFTDSTFGNGSAEDYHDNFFNATDTSALVEAFNRIVDKINDKVGYAGVNYEDGVTVGVTNTSATVDGTVNADSFHYSVYNGETLVYTVSFATAEDGTVTATFKVGNNEYQTNQKQIHEADLNNDGTIQDTEKFEYYSVTAEDGTVYKMAPASMDNNGLIDWELAGLGFLENGYTYTLSFDVWPNQFTYDMVADLNNGVKTISEIKDEVDDNTKWAQIEKAIQVTYTTTDDAGNPVTNKVMLSDMDADTRAALEAGEFTNVSYAILTNYKQEVNYYTAEEKQSSQSGTSITYNQQDPYNPVQPDPVAITSSKMDLRKLWADELDERPLNNLLYNSDGSSKKYFVDLKVWKADTKAALEALIEADAEDTEYKPVRLGWNEEKQDYVWTDSLDVAPGTMISLTKAQEMGIDTSDETKIVTYNKETYYILESGHYYTVSEVNGDWHFDLVTIVYHPMLVNGVLSNVTFNDDGTVHDIVAMSSVDATNTLRGGINLKKVVLDPSGNEYPTDDKFAFTVVLKNENPVFVGDNIPWYGVNGKYYHDENGNYIDSSAAGDADGDGLDDDGNIPEVSDEGKTATYTLTIDSTDSVRINNVPIGTTYTVTETQAEGYMLDSVEVEVGVDVPVYDEQGNPVIDEDGKPVTEHQTDSSEVTHELTVTGTIEPNRENNVTYKNKMDQWPAFYVYHSSDNTIEKIFANDDRVTKTVNEETGLMEMIFNIAAETKATYLYGGYYKGYENQKLKDEQIIALEYNLSDSKEYEYVTKAAATSNWAVEPNGVPYTGETAPNWDLAKAYDENGLAMTAKDNTVYYLKEVLDTRYLQPYTHYTYYKAAPNNIANLWMISDIDDLNYLETGFVVTKNDEATVCSTLTVRTKVGGASVKLKPQTIFKKNGATSNNYLTYCAEDALIKGTSTVKMYWITPDSVFVTSAKQRGLIGDGTKAGLKHTDTDIPSTISKATKGE